MNAYDKNLLLGGIVHEGNAILLASTIKTPLMRVDCTVFGFRVKGRHLELTVLVEDRVANMFR